MLYSFIMKQTILVLIVFFFFGVINLSAESNLLNRPAEEYPLSNTVSLKNSNVYSLSLLPDLPGSKSIVTRFNNYQPEFTVERLYRFLLPVKYSGNTPESRLALFTDIVNILEKPETQVGYTYHSSRKDEDVVLFKKLYISNKKGKQISGSVFSMDTLPKEFSYYQYVNEANFPGTVFKQTILVNDSFLSYRSTNIKTIRLFIFPVVKKMGTRNEVLFFTDRDYLYIYNCTQILKEPALKSLGFPINLSSMFRKRMDVMVEWIKDRLSQSAE